MYLKKYIILFFLFLSLIMVRAFVEPLFYDPLIEYFKHDYLKMPIPKLNLTTYLLNISYRFFLNTIISLAILFVIFKEVNVFLFSVKIYVASFVVLICFLFVLLKFEIIESYLVVFYVRRFLIHPIILLVLIPAFYYQKLILKINK
jgi:exosortase F-associated protein